MAGRQRETLVDGYKCVPCVARGEQDPNIKMVSRSSSFFPNESASSQPIQGYGMSSHIGDSHEPQPNLISMENHSSTLLYSLSILQDKVHQTQSLVSLFASPNSEHPQQVLEPVSITMGRVSTLIQEIMSVSSSTMFTCQQMSLDPNLDPRNTHIRSSLVHPISQSSSVDKLQNNHLLTHPDASEERNIHVAQHHDLGQESKQVQIVASHLFGSCDQNNMEWFGDSNNFTSAVSSYDTTSMNSMHQERLVAHQETHQQSSKPSTFETRPDVIIEMDAAHLLAKYTHYCQVCGKGFKRDANLRMHMRAHGEEYMSSAALSNPTKTEPNGTSLSASNDLKPARRYSCPQEGCRWNRKHPKFQPLKSMICVKNHYKRSHCPKMYVCKRCNQKQFSVLSDLRTHEKHCGDLKWQCSCGTTFSRKDKLMGHVGLFAGHGPVVVNHHCFSGTS